MQHEQTEEDATHQKPMYKPFEASGRKTPTANGTEVKYKPHRNKRQSRIRTGRMANHAMEFFRPPKADKPPH